MVVGENTGLEVNYDSAMIVDPIAEVEDATVLQDLCAPSTSNLTDRYQIWEYKTAFKRTIFQAFRLAVDRAEIKDGTVGKGYVTLSSLAHQLNTTAWADLQDANSELSLVLLSDAFKDANEEQSGDQIDKDTLVIYGLVHCKDKLIPVDKARCFYQLLQDGSLDRFSVLSANDKDLKPRFKTICRLVSTDLFKFASATIENQYEADEQALFNAMEQILEGENQWLDAMYGY